MVTGDDVVDIVSEGKRRGRNPGKIIKVLDHVTGRVYEVEDTVSGRSYWCIVTNTSVGFLPKGVIDPNPALGALAYWHGRHVIACAENKV